MPCPQRQPLWHTLSLGFAMAGVATLAPTSTANCAGLTSEHVSTLPVRIIARMAMRTVTGHLLAVAPRLRSDHFGQSRITCCQHESATACGATLSP